MATITHRVGLSRNLTAAEVDANFDSLATDLALVAGLTVQDEGSPLATAATTLNFAGAGVVVTGAGAVKTVTISAGGDALTTNPLSQFAATTSLQLKGAISDETGSGALVFATSPTLVTPALGAATATSINKITITAPATGATLAIVDGTTVTGPAATGTLMTLGNAEAITGVKTYGSGKMVYAGATSGTTTLSATAIAGSSVLTLPAATDTLIGKATADTLTNKTYDTAGGGNSFSINGVAVTANTGTGSVVRATSPTLVTPTLGIATATSLNKITFTAPATGATVAWVDGTTIAGPSVSGTLVVVSSSVSLTSTNTLTQASHFNRHLSWTGSSTAAQAISATASAGDFVELTNDGSALVTFTGITPLVGFKAECQPGETFQAVYSNSTWVSLTPQSAYIAPVTSVSAARSIVLTDMGTVLFHPSADTTARTWTLPANGTIAIPVGAVVAFDNDISAGVLTLAITTDTLVLVGAAGSTGSRALAAGGFAVAQKVAATRWRIRGGAELT